VKATSGVKWEARVEGKSPLSVWLCIPALPPSLNEWSRQHWRVRHRAVEEMTDTLRLLAIEAGSPKFERAEVQLVYYFKHQRRRDPDNYVPKFVLDGLRKAGIIADDNAEVLRLPQPEFRVDRARPRMEVFIKAW